MARTGTDIQPAGVYNWTAPYGGKPIVPNPNATASSAISGNAANLPGAFNLAGQVNAFNQGQLLDQYSMAIPNYSNLVGQESGIVGNELKGQLPQDVINQITQRAAERGVITGIDSPAANAALIRSLGLNSLQLQQQGFGNFGQMIAQAPKAPLFNLESEFVTPEDIQAADWMRNEIAAAPDPQAAAQLAIGLGQGPSASTWPGANKGNMASINAGPPAYRPAPGSKATNVPVWAQDSMGTIGGVNPFTPAPAGYDQAYFPNYGVEASGKAPGSGNWYYDSTMGAYVNSLTGDISDTAGGQPWEGFSWSGANAPAMEEELVDNYDF